MQKLKFKIIGSKVHNVGYRVLLVNKVLSMGVNNFNVFNTHFNKTQGIIALIEANDENIEEFKNYVAEFKPEEAIVENTSFEKYNNTVPPIERVMQSFQMEQWGKGIPILMKIADKLDTNTSILKENTSILKDFKNESNNNFRDLKDIMERHDVDASGRISSIKNEISEIKNRLSNVEIAVSAL
jgi:hypothetical protein